MPDDQPYSSDIGSQPGPAQGAPVTPPSAGDDLTDSEGAAPQVPSSSPGDAGVAELDAGPDSGSIDPSP